MFCFPNTFGRRDQRGGALPSSPAHRQCPLASVESMTDDEPTSPGIVPDTSTRVARRKKRNTHNAGGSNSSSSSTSANNSRSNSGSREQTIRNNLIVFENKNDNCNNSELSMNGSSESCSDTATAEVSARHGSDSSCEVITPLSPTSTLPTHGTRFKLVREGDIQVCCLNHTRTVVSKILSSKFLRRWETHRLYLNDACISSKTPTGFFESSVAYSSIEEVYVVARWDAGHKFCIRIVVPDGSILLQANSCYTRDQWFHSLLWQKNIFKYRNILKPSSRPDVILKELKSLVDYATSNPLQDECVINATIETVSTLLVDESAWPDRCTSEELISTVGPLLENTTPSSEMCRFFSRHCDLHPRSPVVADVLTPVIHRILKHNVDFGKCPHMRRFVQDYLQALFMQNAGEEVIRKFVTSVHGPSSGCPHPRVLPNLVSVCLAAVFSNYEDRRAAKVNDQAPDDLNDLNETRLQCHLDIFLSISEYDDWRPCLSAFLQPIPFPDEALASEAFVRRLMPVMERIASDVRCEVHQMVLAVRDGKEGWFHVYCPAGGAGSDDGRLWCIMVKVLLQCCCRRKRFLSQLTQQLGTCLLLALRDHAAAQEALCLMLEWRLVEQHDQVMQLVTTLQSTASGRDQYAALCDRQMHLKELQQKGGPRKLTLPSRSTDADIARLLSCGSFGNLECLSLAFTHVTSACAEQIIKLPALRYLNLWATQFGDAGLQMISEHLPKLQVLNLCETPVSDKGIAALSAMTNLCKLNLNSTKLTASTFESLKKNLPGLQEFDVRYTEAW